MALYFKYCSQIFILKAVSEFDLHSFLLYNLNYLSPKNLKFKLFTALSWIYLVLHKSIEGMTNALTLPLFWCANFCFYYILLTFRAISASHILYQLLNPFFVLGHHLLHTAKCYFCILVSHPSSLLASAGQVTSQLSISICKADITEL